MGSFCIASEALTRKKSRMSERVKERGTIPSLFVTGQFYSRECVGKYDKLSYIIMLALQG